MQAITTKYLPATNFLGSRIKATCERGSITIDYPHEFNTERAHRAAALALVDKFIAEDEKEQRYPKGDNPWNRPLLTGGTKDGFAHVYCDDWEDKVLIEFASGEDAEWFRKYAKRARETEGTVTGCLAGIACEAIRKSRI